MLTGQAALGVAASLLFPGVGQGLAGRRLRAVVWAAVTAVTTVLVVASVWFAWTTLALRVVCAGDAVWCLRKQRPSPLPLASAVAAFLLGAVALAAAGRMLDAYTIPSGSMVPTVNPGDRVYVESLSLHWRAPGRGEVIAFEQPCSRTMMIKRVVAIAGDTVEVRCSVLHVNGKAIERTPVGRQTLDVQDSVGTWRSESQRIDREMLGGHTYTVLNELWYYDKSRDFPRDEGLLAGCRRSEFYGPPPPGATVQPALRLVTTGPRPPDLDGEDEKEGTVVDYLGDHSDDDKRDPSADNATACRPWLHAVVPPGALFVLGDNRIGSDDSRSWGALPVSAVRGRVVGVYWSSHLGAAGVRGIRDVR